MNVTNSPSSLSGGFKKESICRFPSHDTGNPVPGSTLVRTFVGGLSVRCTKHRLSQFMSQFGYVKDVYISKDPNNSGHKGFAFVAFFSVFRLQELFGPHFLCGRWIEVKRSLQDYLILKNIPQHISQRDIVHAFERIGYSVSEVLIVGQHPDR